MPTDKLFTGQRLDGTGLYFYNARYYDPTIGRFISADTIVPNCADPQELNRYSYVLNNPLRYTDPTGHVDDEGQFSIFYGDPGTPPPPPPPPPPLTVAGQVGAEALMSKGLKLNLEGVGPAAWLAAVVIIGSIVFSSDVPDQTAKNKAAPDAANLGAQAASPSPSPQGPKKPNGGNNDPTPTGQRPETLQTGLNKITQHTADKLNAFFEKSYTRREWGKLVEKMKDVELKENWDHGKIMSNGNVNDAAGNIIDNLSQYLP